MQLYCKWIFLIISLLLINSTSAYEAVIFDCDGVLVDTEGLKMKAWQQALTQEGVTLSEEDYLPLVGLSSNEIAKKIQHESKQTFNAKTVIAQKEIYYHNLQKQGVPVIKSGVNYLRTIIANKERLNLKLAIVSSASKSEILENLKQMNISPKYFDVILSGKDEGIYKPDPRLYEKCAKMLRVSPQESLVIEDSGPGVESAVKAGMKVIAVPNRFTLNHDFSGAMKVTNNLKPRFM